MGNSKTNFSLNEEKSKSCNNSFAAVPKVQIKPFNRKSFRIFKNLIQCFLTFPYLLYMHYFYDDVSIRLVVEFKLIKVIYRQCSNNCVAAQMSPYQKLC